MLTLNSDFLLEFTSKVSAPVDLQDLTAHRASILVSLLEWIGARNSFAILWLIDSNPKNALKKCCTAWVVASTDGLVKFAPSLPPLDDPPAIYIKEPSKRFFGKEDLERINGETRSAFNNSWLNTGETSKLLVEHNSVLLPITARKLDLNYNTTKLPVSSLDSEHIGFVQVFSDDEFPAHLAELAELPLKIWGNYIQHERKMRAMDGVEYFVQRLRSVVEFDAFVETACNALKSIVNCSRTSAYRRVYQQDFANAECIYDSAQQITSSIFTYPPGTIVFDSFDRMHKSPGAHVSRIWDVTDQKEMSANFRDAQLDESDKMAGVENKKASMVIVSITAPVHGKNGADSKAALVIKLFSEFGDRNIGGRFSETEQYIIAAAAQHISARLPWLLFKKRLSLLKDQIGPNSGVPGSRDENSSLALGDRTDKFLRSSASSIDFVSEIIVVEDEQLFPEGSDAAFVQPPVIYPHNSKLSTDEIQAIKQTSSKKPLLIEIGSRHFFCGRIETGDRSVAWVVVFVESENLTEQDYELVEIVFSETMAFWYGKRDLGEERRKKLEQGHAVLSTLGSALNNIRNAQEIFLEAREMDREEAYDWVFKAAQMRRHLADAVMSGEITRSIFWADRITEKEISPSDIVVETIDLEAITKSLARVFRASANRRGLAIDVSGNYPHDLPVIKGDRQLLTVAMINLIENAVKHSFRDQRIIIRYGYIRPRKWFYQVSNVGVHISEATQKAVLAMGARQAPPAGFASKHGLGFGLAIIQRVLFAHGAHQGLKISSTPLSFGNNRSTITVGFELGVDQVGNAFDNSSRR